MPKACLQGSQILKLTFVCCASLSVLSWTAKAQTPASWAYHDKRSLLPSNASTTTTASNAPGGSAVSSTVDDPRACQKLPITPETWKLLNIDETLKNLPGGQNMTIGQYASAHGAGNFICGIGETCNAGQLCHPVKAPAWQVLYAVQEYNNFMTAMMDSINYALSQLQGVSASMLVDLSPDINESRFVMNLQWLFTDLYRGIAFGAVSLLVIALLGLSLGSSIVAAVVILTHTAIGAGLAAVFQGAPKTASFVPWTKLGFYIAQSQKQLAAHVSEAADNSFTSGITSEKGLATILSNGSFFTPPSPSGLMQTMEQSILRMTQGRLLSRLLRAQNAFITISQSDCHGQGPNGARGGKNILSYCDPNEKLEYNILRAHKKKTIHEIIGGETITAKYGFDIEFIVRNSRDCQETYGNFEHDIFADITKVTPTDLVSQKCILNIPICDTRLDDVRDLLFRRHKTTTVSCRRGAGLPI